MNSLLGMIYFWYLSILMGLLLLYAVIEFVFPERCVSFWNSFIQSPLLSLYGVILIIGGFPLTRYSGSIAGKILFGVGILVVFMGPFILLFPEHFRSAFNRAADQSTPRDLKHIAYSDAVVRLIVSGLIFCVLFL